ncbi:hypothetical protein BC938DRAFT_474817 [Jimgerdemannia flammicorona]|uniref:F-box domain-containing protein n=1 Tax=Jimgerdemannia flammicorona TaxID=994334 RepID=A0A433QZG5_9FUNG|nr:hypothetical protein BC938DRAFT_474817 [Jimgerdemannia flammicorona]
MKRKIQKITRSEKASSKPKLSSPRLPPEVLRHVLCYFDLSRQYPGNGYDNTLLHLDVVLDLMAASMRNHGIHAEKRYGPNIRRFAALLSSAHSLGLMYCRSITAFTILMEAQEPKNYEAFLTIFKLAKPVQLRIVISNETLPDSQARASKRKRFSKALGQHCTHVTSLHLDFPEDVEPTHTPPEKNPFLATHIQAMRASLTSINISNTPDAPTQLALSSCNNVLNAYFANCEVGAADFILRGLGNLRTVDLVDLKRGQISTLLTGLSSVCGQLEELRITETAAIFGTPTSEKLRSENAEALRTLILRCIRLKRLKIWNLPGVDNSVLRVLSLCCPDLEHLYLQSLHWAGDELTGAGIWNAIKTPWPRLQELTLMYEQVDPEFLGLASYAQLYISP